MGTGETETEQGTYEDILSSQAREQHSEVLRNNRSKGGGGGGTLIFASNVGLDQASSSSSSNKVLTPSLAYHRTGA